MNSFTVTAVGQLARNPEQTTKAGAAWTKFCLIGNDYAGKGQHGDAREVVTRVHFVAFGALGETIAKSALVGDQLIVRAHIRDDDWVDKDGLKQHGHSFIVEGFRFGAPGRAKRGHFETRADQGEHTVPVMEA